MFGIPLSTILKQLKDDLIGKDSHRGVTLTYSWLANQFGHFALGFIPTFIVYLALFHNTDWQHKEFWAALIISCAWIAFETYNFLGPLLTKRPAKKDTMFTGGPRYKFQPRWGFIAFDTITDLLFFTLGSFTCASLINPVLHWNIFVVIAAGVLLLYPIAFWFTSKLHLMNSGFPMQFRLSQWDREIVDENIEKINAYCKTDSPQHLLIFGSRGTGKSSLAVAVGSELSTQKKRKKCAYYTGIKLYCRFYQADNEFDSPFLWNWSTSDCLIIDDINPGLPMTTDIVEPSDFMSYVEHAPYTERNKQVLSGKKVIWVMGENESGTKEQISNWKDLLERIGVHPSNMTVVDLTQKKKAEEKI